MRTVDFLLPLSEDVANISNCRAKVKCSKERPKCQHCRTHGLDCRYEEAPLGSPSLAAQTRPFGSWPNLGINEDNGISMGDTPQALPAWFLPEGDDVGSHSNPSGSAGINAMPDEPLPWTPIHPFAEFDLGWIFDSEPLGSQPGIRSNSQPLTPETGNWSLPKTPDIVLANATNIIPLLQQEPVARPPVQVREVPRLDTLSIRHTVYFESSRLEESTRQRLLEACQVPAQRGPWHDIELTNFPGCKALECCIDLFLVHFHSVSVPSPNQLIEILKVLAMLIMGCRT
jgi:hypothetical protein